MEIEGISTTNLSGMITNVIVSNLGEHASGISIPVSGRVQPVVTATLPETSTIYYSLYCDR